MKKTKRNGIYRPFFRLISVLAIILVSSAILLSCSSGNPGDNTVQSGENGQSPAPAAEESDSFTSNHEILDDYKNIEIGGTHDVRIMFVNAGKADSIIVEADGLYYVIDTGEATSVPKINASLEYMGADKIEAVFLTHSNNDHINGLYMLSELWDIGACYTAAVSVSMQKIQIAIEKAGLVQTTLEPGSVIKISDGLYFEVLGPYEYNPLDENANSLVMRFTVNGVTTLFTGDMQYDEEKTLMRAGFDLSCDILKIGHHGRKDATSVTFLDEASPKIAVICTDREVDKSTAHKSVRSGLNDKNVDTYITDEYDLGLLCVIDENGDIDLSDAEAPDNTLDISIESISKEDQTVVIKNNDKSTADISRWYIISERGGEVFVFPDGTSIDGGGTLTVACSGYTRESDLTWEDSRVWNRNKDDRGLLIDRYGSTVDSKNSK